MSDTPFIHLLRQFNGYYFFDVNTNSVVEISEQAYRMLESVLAGAEQQPCADIPCLAPLVQQGYLRTDRVRVLEHTKTQLLPTLLDRQIDKLTLQVTQGCNLRCSYCVYSDLNNQQQRTHSSRSMSFPLAKQAVDFLMEHSIDSDSVNIGFYGGEPLLEFRLIKQVVEYIKAEYPAKDTTYAITTNGTLLTEEIAEFFYQNNVMLTVSIDGPEAIHNVHRRFAANGKGSFASIMQNIEKMQAHFAAGGKKLDISVNMVVDPQNEYDEIISLKKENPCMEAVNVRSTIVDDVYSADKTVFSTAFIEKRNYDIFLAYLSDAGLVEGLECSSIGQDTCVKTKQDIENRSKISGLVETSAPGGPCVPGQRRLFVNVDGNFFPCERVSETSPIMNIGNIQDGFDLEKCEEMLNIGRLTPEKCKTCWAFSNCTLCAKMADNDGEYSGALKATHCVESIYNLETQILAEIVLGRIQEFKAEANL